MNTQNVTNFQDLPWSQLENYDNVFIHRAYVTEWFSHLAGPGKPNSVVSTEADGTIQCFFPMVSYPQQCLAWNTEVWKPIGWNGAWYPYSFYPLSVGTLAAYLQYLDEASAWDLVWVVLPTELCSEYELHLGNKRRWVTKRISQITMPAISITGTWASYWEERNGRVRKNIRWLQNKLAKTHDYQFRSVLNPDELDHLLDVFVEMHYRRWQLNDQESDYTVDQERNAFLRNLAHELLMEKKLYMPYLIIDSQIAATAVCIVDSGVLYYTLTTYNLDLEQFSPGKLLLHHIVQYAFQCGLHKVDLGPGKAEYKDWFSNSQEDVIYSCLSRNRTVSAFYVTLPAFRRRIGSGLRIAKIAKNKIVHAASHK